MLTLNGLSDWSSFMTVPYLPGSNGPPLASPWSL